MKKILVVDDELLIRTFLSETLIRQGYEVQTVENVKEATSILNKDSFDLVFTDMKMPDGSGLDVVKVVKSICPTTVVVVITAFGSIENAVKAMQMGSFDYVIKPFSPDMIETVLQKVESHIKLIQENQYLRHELGHKESSSKMTVVAESPVMQKVLTEVEKIADSEANIFITGESGTGKEVIAGLIHRLSKRRDNPYIRVNCAAVPETLVESEFFGHEKGSFTGATASHKGRFELANKGTLLLDEVSEVPLHLQAKFLRAIQEKEFERVGGVKTVKVDVRFISTSNRTMQEAIDNKEFREDLFYRLNVLPVFLPSLRDRKEDIIPLANHFLTHFCLENHKKKKTLSQSAKDKLENYRWPGNIRELANVIERAVVMDFDNQIEAEHLYIDGALDAPPSQEDKSVNIKLGTRLEEVEKEFILKTLRKNEDNRGKTAEELGITTQRLRNRLKEYGKNS